MRKDMGSLVLNVSAHILCAIYSTNRHFLAFMNIVETLLNLYYLYLAHISDSASAPLVGFSGALMTLSKTLLYWAQEYYCNFCAVGHNSVNDLVLYWILPNGYV